MNSEILQWIKKKQVATMISKVKCCDEMYLYFTSLDIIYYLTVININFLKSSCKNENNNCP